VDSTKACPCMTSIIAGQLPSIGKWRVQQYSPYRPKLTCELQLTAKLSGQPWTPSLPPAPTSSDTASSGTLRKSRASTRGGLSVGTSRDTSASPAASSAATPIDRKTANEAYFTSLGEVCAFSLALSYLTLALDQFFPS
jgi:hypothetical protein